MYQCVLDLATTYSTRSGNGQWLVVRAHTRKHNLILARHTESLSEFSCAVNIVAFRRNAIYLTFTKMIGESYQWERGVRDVEQDPDCQTTLHWWLVCGQTLSISIHNKLIGMLSMHELSLNLCLGIVTASSLWATLDWTFANEQQETWILWRRPWKKEQWNLLYFMQSTQT